MSLSHLLAWSIAAAATAGVILRPLRVPEAVWAVAGAALLVGSGLLPVSAALRGIGRGTDVYLFLLGMMLLAELARQTGLFDWLAALAASHARGSAMRLFGLVYLVGLVVTVFLSNDATAVVLTPAVAAVARAARVNQPLPFLLICAFIANAASFVLPISNPANLVLYAGRMPPLTGWLAAFALPSLLAIVVTYGILRHTQRRSLQQSIPAQVTAPTLSVDGKVAAMGIAGTGVLLMLASQEGWRLGLTTCLAGILTWGAGTLIRRSLLWRSLRDISWGVIALVAGLFVLVEALDQSGVIGLLANLLSVQAQRSPPISAAGAGIVVGVASNLTNNLPAGLVAATAVQAANLPGSMTRAILIGVDLGPNLSVTGSLATILWLSALRREGIHVGAAEFLRLGVVIMPPALLLALAAAVWIPVPG